MWDIATSKEARAPTSESSLYEKWRSLAKRTLSSSIVEMTRVGAQREITSLEETAKEPT